jgi:hypothetical protein
LRKEAGGIGVLNIGREKRDSHTMAFEAVAEARVETFSVSENGGHKLSWVIMFQDCRLIGFDSVGGGVGSTESIALKAKKKIPNPMNFFWGAFLLTGGEGELTL